MTKLTKQSKCKTEGIFQSSQTKVYAETNRFQIPLEKGLEPGKFWIIPPYQYKVCINFPISYSKKLLSSLHEY